MVKTRSDLKGTRVSTKAPRKSSVPSPAATGGRSSKKYNGTNSYCPREVPIWQKEITNFFSKKQADQPDPGASSSDQITFPAQPSK